jgi:hypothetical protein
MCVLLLTLVVDPLSLSLSPPSYQLFHLLLLSPPPHVLFYQHAYQTPLSHRFCIICIRGMLLHVCRRVTAAIHPWWQCSCLPKMVQFARYAIHACMMSVGACCHTQLFITAVLPYLDGLGSVRKPFDAPPIPVVCSLDYAQLVTSIALHLTFLLFEAHSVTTNWLMGNWCVEYSATSA